MRTLTTTLLCLLTFCPLLFLSECGPGSLADVDAPVITRIQCEQVPCKAELSTPDSPTERAPLAVPTRTRNSLKATKSRRREPIPRGYLQVQITQPLIPRQNDAYALRVSSLDGKSTVAICAFTELSFELAVPVGEYKLIVCDASYPWDWIPNSDPKTTAGPKQLLLHQETIRIRTGANTIVAIDTQQGGRFWLHATSMPTGSDHAQTLIEEARIGTQAPGICCYFIPMARVTPVLREYPDGKQVPLAWASTDMLSETGYLDSDRGYLMQNVLPAGEYEISMNAKTLFSGDEEREHKLQFTIIDGETTPVVLSLREDQLKPNSISGRDRPVRAGRRCNMRSDLQECGHSGPASPLKLRSPEVGLPRPELHVNFARNENAHRLALFAGVKRFQLHPQPLLTFHASDQQHRRPGQIPREPESADRIPGTFDRIGPAIKPARFEDKLVAPHHGLSRSKRSVRLQLRPRCSTRLVRLDFRPALFAHLRVNRGHCRISGSHELKALQQRQLVLGDTVHLPTPRRIRGSNLVGGVRCRQRSRLHNIRFRGHGKIERRCGRDRGRLAARIGCHAGDQAKTAKRDESVVLHEVSRAQNSASPSSHSSQAVSTCRASAISDQVTVPLKPHKGPSRALLAHIECF